MASSERTERDAAGAQGAERDAAGAAVTADAGFSGQGVHQGGQAANTPGPVAAAEVTPEQARTVSCLTNAHYHSAREAFLDTLHRWFMFFVIALGAAALTDVLPKILNWLLGIVVDVALVKEACSAGAAILAALDLTFDLSNRARAHAMMKRRYFELLAALRQGKKTAEEVHVCLDEFSADEEPPYRVLYLTCWNLAQMTVFGHRAKRFEIGFWDRLFKNWWRRPAAKYRAVAAT